jgi:pimeloyl-ACP methyl ester carboxylesterase
MEAIGDESLALAAEREARPEARHAPLATSCAALLDGRVMSCGESVRFPSQGASLSGALFLPEAGDPVPAVIVCHGAGDWKENYFELCEYLVGCGIAALAIDLHGHGQSEGDRFFVQMRRWVPNIHAAIDYLTTRKEVDPNRIGAFGLSSGGTAIMEASLLDARLRTLVTLDATVRNSLPRAVGWLLKGLLVVGRLKERLTGKPWRLPLAKISVGPKLASDPEVNARILGSPRFREAFLAFPLPGAEEAFFVDTIKRAPNIDVPTLVLWGAEDNMDPPETGHRLFAALRCKKRLEVIPGNGHVGHLDRHRTKVFALTADWVRENLGGKSDVLNGFPSVRVNRGRVIDRATASKLGRQDKWDLLSPLLRRFGREPLAYATLQDGMEYYIEPGTGFVAFNTVQHPILAPRPRRITLSEPVCAPEERVDFTRRFLAGNPRASFGQISESFAEILRPMGFKANCLGIEPVLPVQTYNTQGNWKELDLVKRARNEARRERLVIREESGLALRQKASELTGFSNQWIGTKRINDREIWLYARRPIFDHEEDVRKFVAYDPEGKVAGFAFYDPMYRDGCVYGYSANIVRCDERRFGRLATALHMEAIDKFRAEGKEVLNLLLSPFHGFENARFNDDFGVRFFFKLSARYGNEIYNFKGLAFHKSKYRGLERPIYYASNSIMPGNDVYLAFATADIARSYFGMVAQLLRGMIHAHFKPNSG